MTVEHTPLEAEGLPSAQPLARPIKRGKTVHVPERWNGPLSHAPFEVALETDGTALLGVGLVCPKGHRRTGALWIPCANGLDLYHKAEALDAVLAANPDGPSPDTKGRVAGVPAARVREAIVWLEAGAEGPQSCAQMGLRASGARSLFSERVRWLKQAFDRVMPHAPIAALAARSPSHAFH